MESSVIKPLGKSLYTRFGVLFPFVFGILMVLVTIELWPDPFDMFIPALFTFVLFLFGFIQFKQTVTLSTDELTIALPLSHDKKIRLQEVKSLWYSKRGWTFFNKGFRYHRLSYTYGDGVTHDQDLYVWDKGDIIMLIKKIRDMYPAIKEQ